MKLGARLNGQNGFIHLPSGARGQHVASGLSHAGEDVRNLGNRLAGGEDDLRHTGAQGAVVIELGETEILEGQVAQAAQGFFHASVAVPDVVEQLFNMSAIHQRPSFALRGLACTVWV